MNLRAENPAPGSSSERQAGARAAEKSPRRLGGAVLAGLVVLPLPLVARIAGLDSFPFRLCVLKLATGVSCPTCGGTRALARLGALDLSGAFALNPGVSSAWLLLVGWAILRLAGLLPALSLPRPGWPSWLLKGLAVGALLLNWAYVALRDI